MLRIKRSCVDIYVTARGISIYKNTQTGGANLLNDSIPCQANEPPREKNHVFSDRSYRSARNNPSRRQIPSVIIQRRIWVVTIEPGIAQQAEVNRVPLANISVNSGLVPKDPQKTTCFFPKKQLDALKKSSLALKNVLQRNPYGLCFRA